jgi:PilZ domain
MPTPQHGRRFERAPFFVEVTLALPQGGHLVEARSVDISLGGVGLICPVPLAVGSVITLTFSVRGRTGAVEECVVGRVASLRYDDDASLVGVEFVEPLKRESAPTLVREIEWL